MPHLAFKNLQPPTIQPIQPSHLSPVPAWNLCRSQGGSGSGPLEMELEPLERLERLERRLPRAKVELRRLRPAMAPPLLGFPMARAEIYGEMMTSYS